MRKLDTFDNYPSNNEKFFSTQKNYRSHFFDIQKSETKTDREVLDYDSQHFKISTYSTGRYFISLLLSSLL